MTYFLARCAYQPRAEARGWYAQPLSGLPGAKFATSGQIWWLLCGLAPLRGSLLLFKQPDATAIDATPDGRWTFNGAAQEDVAGLVDIDLGFTPATNLIQLRRLALDIGHEADAPAAYLNFPELTLERLEQRYKRAAHDTYAYQAPHFDYAAQLQVSNHGFVTQYPCLWEVEALE